MVLSFAGCATIPPDEASKQGGIQALVDEHGISPEHAQVVLDTQDLADREMKVVRGISGERAGVHRLRAHFFRNLAEASLQSAIIVSTATEFPS